MPLRRIQERMRTLFSSFELLYGPRVHSISKFNQKVLVGAANNRSHPSMHFQWLRKSQRILYTFGGGNSEKESSGKGIMGKMLFVWQIAFVILVGFLRRDVGFNLKCHSVRLKI